MFVFTCDKQACGAFASDAATCSYSTIAVLYIMHEPKHACHLLHESEFSAQNCIEELSPSLRAKIPLIATEEALVLVVHCMLHL